LGLALETYVRGEGRDRCSELNDRHLEQEQCSSIEFWVFLRGPCMSLILKIAPPSNP
jgi:hypothetical protein